MHTADVEPAVRPATYQRTAAGVSACDWLPTTDGRVHRGAAQDKVLTGGYSI